MTANRICRVSAIMAVTLGLLTVVAAADNRMGHGRIRHVLLISIDGMHAVDFHNCQYGIEGANNGEPYCPNMAELARRGINYVAAVSSKPSDSFPGIAALVTGGSPKSTGLYYDVAYDRSLDGPAKLTGTGLPPSPCNAGEAPTGTTTDNDQGVDLDDTMLNGGAPNASPTEGGIASLDPGKMSRDPAKNCAPVYPWNFVRTNTIFGVVHAAGGYTAWIDKHPSYSMVGGPGGHNLDDYYSPEVDSNVINLPGVTTAEGLSCATPLDASSLSGWNSSFANIQCYDALRMNGLLNQIAGRTHDGKPAQIPAVFGMNFQSVYTGQVLIEPNLGVGGYQNAAGLPNPELVSEIQYVDTSIGMLVSALKNAGIYDSTLIIITAKHGMSPIDPNLLVTNPSNTPATLLGSAIPSSESPLSGGIGATEDDVSVLWLAKGASIPAAVKLLEDDAQLIGLGQIFYGPSLAINYNVGGLGKDLDPRSPDIIVTPNVGMTYIPVGSALGDHGGFGHDDTNVIMLVSNPRFTPETVSSTTTTMQVAPTVLTALGLDPKLLDAVLIEGTAALPEVAEELERH
jgi:Type I phosphodiesterase / nucleotide pyrophosphatase